MGNDDLKSSIFLYHCHGLGAIINVSMMVLTTALGLPYPCWLFLWQFVVAGYYTARWWQLGKAVLREKLRRGLL